MAQDHTLAEDVDTPWWHTHRAHYDPANIAYFEAEARATRARVFCMSAFPTPAQTPEYAEAVLRSFTGAFASDKIERTMAVRAIRRDAYLRRELTASFIVDASVLRRPAGSEALMVAQRAHTLALHSSGQTPIKVVDGFYVGLETSFSLFDVDGIVLAFEDVEMGMVQANNARRDELVARFDELEGRSVPLPEHPLMAGAA
jgi:hypothetical protein